MNGSLALAGTFVISALPDLAPGTYTLMTYTGSKYGVATVQMPAGYSGNLDTSTPRQVDLVISPAGTLLIVR